MLVKTTRYDMVFPKVPNLRKKADSYQQYDLPLLYLFNLMVVLTIVKKTCGR